MPDDPRSIDVSPEFARLSEECELLKEELAALFAEWEHTVRTVIPNLEADYVVKLGALQHQLLQLQIDIQRTKREIDIIQAALNRGETVDDQMIQQQLENEFEGWKAKLDGQLKEITDAELRLSSLMSPEDSVELRKLYRVLAKKLHPDVNPDQSQESQNLWIQVQSAYEMGDLKQLQALHILAEDIPDNYDLPGSIDLLRKRRSDLKEQVTNMLQKMAELRKLPIFQWEQCLQDSESLAEEQRLIREQIEQASEQLASVRSALGQIKKAQNNE